MSRRLGGGSQPSWAGVLTAILACLFVFLGATSPGIAGSLGVIGGVVVLVVLVASTWFGRRWSVALLCGAVAPFGVLTWWSIVTPLIAILAVLLGSLAIGRRAPSPRDRSVSLDDVTGRAIAPGSGTLV